MTKRFETTKDLEREAKAISMLCDKYGFKVEKLGDYDLDFRVFKICIDVAIDQQRFDKIFS